MFAADVPDWVYRLTLALVLLVNFATVGVYRSRAQSGERFSLKDEPLWILIGLRGSALLLLSTLILEIVAPTLLAWAHVSLPDALRMIAALIALCILPPLVMWAQRSLGSNVTTTVVIRENHELVTTGAYRWVRHPLYTLGALFYVCLALMTENWLLLLLGILVFTVVAKRTRIEERHLIARFGVAYERYAEQTGRYLPRLMRRNR